MKISKDTILVSAFAANPAMSSETGIGWSFIKASAKIAADRNLNVIAITNKRSELAVNQELRLLGLDGVAIAMGIDMPVGLRWLLRPQLTRLEYLAWYFMAKRMVRRIGSSSHILLAHHVTFATEMFPTPIVACEASTLKVWGPIGSAGDPNVYRVEPVSGAVKHEERMQRLRDLIVRVPIRWFGRRVDLVLAQNAIVENNFRLAGIDVELFPNVIIKEPLQCEINSIDDTSRVRQNSDDDGSLRILSVGHLIPRKRFDLGILALTDPKLKNATYSIAGRPLPGYSDYLPEFALSLGVSDRVEFLGKLTRSEILSHMADFDILFHPSGREGASGVVGEATAMGIPVVCFDNTGASSVLDDAGVSGIKIIATADTTASDLALALLRAAKLNRERSTVWSEARFERLLAKLVDTAFAKKQLSS